MSHPVLKRPLAVSTTQARFVPRRLVAAITVMAVTVLIAACGQSPNIALTVDSPTVEVVRGSEALVVVTLTRNGGAAADVALTVSGLPANVTASFAPATLSGSDLESVLTVTATGAAVEGSHELTVTGTGTGLTATTTMTLDVISLTVTGRVELAFGNPLAGASVASQGEASTTTTDGSFTLSGLSIPYDLSVWDQAETWVQIYEGLSTSSLLLTPTVGFGAAPTHRSTPVSGTLTGDSIPMGPNQSVLVCLEPMGTGGSDMMACGYANPATSAYSFNAQWWGATSRAVRLHAIQVETDANGFPVSYPGYATANLTITNASAVNLNLDLGEALDTTTVAVTIDAESAIAGTFAAVQVGPRLAMLVMNAATPVTALSVVMPVIEDATYAFVSRGGTLLHYGWQAGVSGSTATLHVPALPVHVEPDDSATGITTGSSFSASATGGGPVTFLWTPDNGDHPAVAVTSMSNAQTFPDLAPYGMSVPASAGYSWYVVTQAGNATEAGTAPLSDLVGTLYLQTIGGAPGPFGDGSLVQSTARSFTTAP